MIIINVTNDYVIFATEGDLHGYIDMGIKVMCHVNKTDLNEYYGNTKCHVTSSLVST